MNKPAKKYITSDLHFASYLNLFGIEPQFSLQGGRIVFLFDQNETFDRLVNEFNSNTAVRVLDFCLALRRMKAKMLSEKDRKMNMEKNRDTRQSFR